MSRWLTAFLCLVFTVPFLEGSSLSERRSKIPQDLKDREPLCPNGFYRHSVTSENEDAEFHPLTCYIPKLNEYKTYDSTHEFCKKFNSEMIEVETKEEQEFVEQFARTAKDGVWLKVEKECDFVDDIFSNWDDKARQRTCPIMNNNGTWSIGSCNGGNVVCEKYINATCSRGKDLKGRLRCTKKDCFCYSHSKNMATWYEAEKDCIQKGGNLASIHSKDEMEWIYETFKASIDGTWIGLNDLWLEGTFRWSDGTNLEYTNWNSNQPDGDTDLENCVHYGISECLNDKWNDEDCNRESWYLCKYEPFQAPRQIRSLNW